MLFQPFKRATRPETPGYLNAEIQRANFENRAQQQQTALRQQTLAGGAELYSEATAPDGIFGTQEAAPVVDANPIIDPIGNAYVPAEAAAGEVPGYASSVAPEFSAAGEAAAAAAPEAVVAPAAEAGVGAAEMAAASEGAAAMGAEAAAAAAASEAAAAGATAAEIAAVEAAAIEAAAATTAASGAGGAAAGTGALAAMGPVGWAALAALALSYA